MSIAETRQVVFSAQMVTGTRNGIDKAAGRSQERHAAFCVQMLLDMVGLRLLECGPGMVEAIMVIAGARHGMIGAMRRSLRHDM